ncbi:two-component sensor histidine kinase [Paenibacillus sp. CAA11]|uniref:sensor histidine kinase n=1 Tax=Paenibacillus sp. CAA11 TaxID=1532905 RepID=UPI000D36C10B|nr:sensor histidine kinase [Paenibacillus sp. CAA11]AWB43206.1 two-component sensor histidine kinase [Paenibacillus sp. CAA11]
MNRILLALRYTLIIVPAGLAVYNLSHASMDKYAMHLLILLNLAVLADRFIRKEALLFLFYALEIVYALWICEIYHPMLFFLSFSPMLMYLRLPRPVLRLLLLGGHAGLLNLLPEYDALSGQISANLMFALCAALISLFQHSAGTQLETIQLYDEIRWKHYELEEARGRLREFAQQVENAAQLEERNRISRQLHDELGHRLIRVKIMLEAALHTVPADPSKGLSMLEQIRDQVSASLEEMRSTVRRLKPANASSKGYSLEHLLEEVGRETGIHTSLKILGEPYALYPSMEIVFYKNAREAVTNALKHGQPGSISIELTYGDKEVTMKVSNDGRLPSESSLFEKGMGLAGMKERVQLIGGRLETELAPHFAVITGLPVRRNNEMT